MKQKLLLLFIFCLLFSLVAIAQERTITGIVTNKEDGKPLSGVTVKVVSGKASAQTNAKGAFSINVPSLVKSLEFS